MKIVKIFTAHTEYVFLGERCKVIDGILYVYNDKEEISCVFKEWIGLESYYEEEQE